MFPGVGLVFAEGRQLFGRLPPEIGALDFTWRIDGKGFELPKFGRFGGNGNEPQGRFVGIGI